jgi:hypothetical protein
VQKFAGILRDYGIGAVTGDNFAGNTFKSDFEAHGITYRSCRRSRSDLYEALEPKLNAHEVELPDLPTMIEQAVCLVWRGQRIDHEPGSHDDWINATAVAAFIVLDRRDTDELPIMSGKVWNSSGAKIADGVSAFFDRLAPKPAPTTNEMLHQANLKAQHEEMRRLVEPHGPPADWDALAAANKAREANQPPKLLFYGKLLGGGR